MQAFKLAAKHHRILTKSLIITSRKGLETAQQKLQDTAMV